ncbi:nucleoside hydrolase [Komagataeibacter rhaeticus]|nr:nucleoside hydrolase [Komagataeibacter xylinus]EGG77182.1 hypothetical protein SXCC_02394 [Gluconacetobacter sp. SXCC-1]PYD54424.1 nucleoside hydrolase [Komagataeibacter rhaeticus]
MTPEFQYYSIYINYLYISHACRRHRLRPDMPLAVPADAPRHTRRRAGIPTRTGGEFIADRGKIIPYVTSCPERGIAIILHVRTRCGPYGMPRNQPMANRPEPGKLSFLKRRIIIDTDPGQDDAVAIFLALASPEITVQAIVAVAGNVPRERTLENACRVLEMAGRTDIPVFAGAARPLRPVQTTAEHVHGPTGLDGIDLSVPPAMAVQEHDGVTYLVDAIRRAQPQELTLVMLGPLTDLAMALTLAPDIAGRIREVVLMGGAWSELGNITPAAEFNIYADPQAADIVFSAGIPLVVLPLDVTHKCLGTPERLAALRANANRCSVAAADMLSYSERFDLHKYGWKGAPLHDPCTIAWLVAPELFGGRHVNVGIETEGRLSVGMTVVDWWKVTDRKPNALFVREVDSDAFYSLLATRLATLP